MMLAERLSVSLVTIKRDIKKLTEQGTLLSIFSLSVYAKWAS
jgi:DeoR/GlpR family transcriptional regulator of sugar metabolism